MLQRTPKAKRTSPASLPETHHVLVAAPLTNTAPVLGLKSRGVNRGQPVPIKLPTPEALRKRKYRAGKKKHKKDPLTFVRVGFHQTEIDAMTLDLKAGRQDRDRVQTPEEYERDLAAMVRTRALAALPIKKRR